MCERCSAHQHMRISPDRSEMYLKPEIPKSILNNNTSANSPVPANVTSNEYGKLKYRFSSSSSPQRHRQKYLMFRMQPAVNTFRSNSFPDSNLTSARHQPAHRFFHFPIDRMVHDWKDPHSDASNFIRTSIDNMCQYGRDWTRSERPCRRCQEREIIVRVTLGWRRKHAFARIQIVWSTRVHRE